MLCFKKYSGAMMNILNAFRFDFVNNWIITFHQALTKWIKCCIHLCFLLLYVPLKPSKIIWKRFLEFTLIKHAANQCHTLLRIIAYHRYAISKGRALKIFSNQNSQFTHTLSICPGFWSIVILWIQCKQKSQEHLRTKNLQKTKFSYNLSSNVSRSNWIVKLI